MQLLNEDDLNRLVNKALRYRNRSLDPWLDSYYKRAKNFGFEYYRLAYFLAHEMQPEIIVELGTQYAQCAAHFAAGSPDSRVVTIDCLDVRQQPLFEHSLLDRYPNIELMIYHSTDSEVLAQFEEHSIGICFADTQHNTPHVLREIDLWTPKMIPGGVWLIDDLREMPDLFEQLPFEVKQRVFGLHTNPLPWPDQEFAYALIGRDDAEQH